MQYRYSTWGKIAEDNKHAEINKQIIDKLGLFGGVC